jgi:spore coat polysaccharide biosynthesis protein SpsF
MKTVAIIQARIGSSRLPGKVLMPLGGTSVLGCVVDRLRVSRRLDDVIVATSELSADDAVVSEARRLNVAVARGSADDVLARFFHAALEARADVVVRITSDCPLIDGAVVDEVIDAHAHGRCCDYASNTITRTYPRGLDTEVFSVRALERAHGEASLPYQREHVTPYFYQNPQTFRLCSYVDPSGADRSALRWTLDTAADYAFLEEVYARIAHETPCDVTTDRVIALLNDDPSLTAINADVRQKEFAE